MTDADRDMIATALRPFACMAVDQDAVDALRREQHRDAGRAVPPPRRDDEALTVRVKIGDLRRAMLAFFAVGEL